MRPRKVWHILGLALIVMVGIQGCSKSPGPVTPVQGRITFKGYQLNTGTVCFVPDVTRGESGPLGIGQIRPDGSYTLVTSDSPTIQGVPAGWYRVTITSHAPPVSISGQPFAMPQSYIPEKYRNPEQSMLVCEVKPNRTNTIDFNLE